MDFETKPNMNENQQPQSVQSSSSPNVDNSSLDHPNSHPTVNHVIHEENGNDDEGRYTHDEIHLNNHHNHSNPLTAGSKVCGAAFNTMPIYDPQGSLVGLQASTDRNLLEDFDNEGRNEPLGYSTYLESGFHHHHLHNQYNLALQQNANMVPGEYNLPYGAYAFKSQNRHLFTPLPCQQQQQQQQQYHQPNYSFLHNYQQAQYQQPQNHQQTHYVHQYQPQAAKTLLVRSASGIIGIDQNNHNNPDAFRPLSDETFDKCPIVCSLFAILCCPITIWCSLPALVYSLCAYSDYRASDIIQYRHASCYRIFEMAYREVLHSSSEDESSSNDDICWKRRKSDIRASPMKEDFSVNIPKKPYRKNRNCVWVNVINEYKLDDALSVAHVHEKCDSSRGVESYLVNTDTDDERKTIEVCTQPELSTRILKKSDLSIKQRLGPLLWDQEVSRSHIDVTFDSPPDLVAETITNLLKEPNEDLIKRTVDILGVQRALEFYYLTEDIENNGGLYLMDGSRRRSPGGVYLNLIKHSYSVKKEEKKLIFLIDRQMKDKLKRARRNSRRVRKYEQSDIVYELPSNPAKSVESDCPSPLDIHSSQEPVILEGEISQPASPVITMDTTCASPCEKSPEDNESMEEGELPPSDDDI
ncbi:unnamed protein product [Schistosoma mattheei]|uniref:Phosphorylated adapter RNA export protein n=1 Tax=Schistosoma mattheei TaxID=31246 RepID=A0AA85BVE8_9TREM|nr:unnamed protein product [Schistosoma mattheei]